MHGAPAPLSHRPVHMTVDATGRFALAAYNNPAELTVHRINSDGTLGAMVEQPAGLDFGIYAHQVRVMPGGRSVALITRGNDATPTKAEDPGAIKLFHFHDGRLSPMASLTQGGHGGLGYGPRHIDFHPRLPFAYVAVERQNQLHMHRVEGDGLSERR
jgi:6-phosphogluconolactonase (cycloisomerase 2 family)